MSKKRDIHSTDDIMVEIEREEAEPQSPPASVTQAKQTATNEKDAPEGHEVAEKLIEDSTTDEERAAEVVAKQKQEQEEKAASENKDVVGNAESSGEIAAAQEAVQEAKEQVDSDDSIPQEKKKQATQELAQQLYKVKIDGEEKEVPLEDLIANYQKGTAAYKKFEEAAKLKKEADERMKMDQELLRLLKEDPRALLMHPEVGHSREDIRKLAEGFLVEELELEQMTPEQRELKELRAKLKQQEEEKAQAEAAEREARIEAQKEHLAVEWTNTIKDILPKYGLPASARTIAQMATHKERALEQGYDLPWEEAAKLTKEDFMRWQREIYNSLDGDDLVKVLGQDVADKLRKATLAKAKPTPPPSPSTPSAPKANIEEDDKPKRRYARDVLDEIRKEYGLD